MAGKPRQKSYLANIRRSMDKWQEIQDDIKKFSDKTFGDHRIAKSMIPHLKKEVDELNMALDEFYEGAYLCTNNWMDLFNQKIQNVRMEYADCLIFILDSAAHFHYPITTDELLKAIKDKMEINKGRKWGKPDENGITEHIK